MNDFADFIQTIITGISLGCIYALVALGLVMLFKATKVFSFVHGEIMMLGAFVAYTCISYFETSYITGFIIAVAFTGILGALIERITIRSLIGKPIYSIIMLTIGMTYVFKGAVSMIPAWGVDTYSFQTPFTNEFFRYDELGLVVAQDHFFLIICAAALILLLGVFFKFTKMGVAMRAASQNQLAAVYMGINVNTVFAVTWCISAALCGIAGVLLSPISYVHMNMGFLVIKAFPAAVLGGFSSIPGAILGGLIIGLAESLSGFYLSEGWKDIAAWLILIIILLARPQGLLGIQEKKKV